VTSYQIWIYIAIGSFVISGIFLAIALIIFFRGHILSVIAILNGKAEKKDIERIQSEIGEGSTTGKFEFYDKTKGRIKNEISATDSAKTTEPLKAQPARIRKDDGETDLLFAMGAIDDDTTMLISDDKEQDTTLLTETSPNLISETPTTEGLSTGNVSSRKFQIVWNEVVFHTDEVI
jgi:hypothetical protein